MSISSVVLTEPSVTVGRTDQAMNTEDGLGRVVGVINDGNSLTTAMGNSYDRRLSNNNTNGFNFRPERLSNVDLTSLNAPSWTTTPLGADNDWPDEIGSNAFYSFGCLALGNEEYWIAQSLAGSQHESAAYADQSNQDVAFWNGNAFWRSTDAGATWRTRTGILASAFNWGGAMPSNDCTLIPQYKPGLPNRAWTMAQFLQMGAGYSDNTDGYVYLYSQLGLEDDTSGGTMLRQTIVARCFIGVLHDQGSNIFNPANWSVWNGSGWSTDFTTAASVMTWPNAGDSGGQAWIPSVTYLPSQSIYIACASEKSIPGYPPVNVKFHMMSAPAPEGPWTLEYSSGAIALQGDTTNGRPFEPNWFAGQTDIDAGTDGSGNQLVDCYYSFSGLGNTSSDPAWWNNSAIMARYGMNIGKVRLTFGAGTPPPVGAAPVVAEVTETTDTNSLESSITVTAPAGTQPGDLLQFEVSASREGAMTTAPGTTQLINELQIGGYAGTSNRLLVAYRIAQAGDAGAGFTFQITDGVVRGRCLRITGADASAPYDGAPAVLKGQNTTMPVPVGSTSGGNRLALYPWCAGNIDPVTIPAGFTAIGALQSRHDTVPTNGNDWHGGHGVSSEVTTQGPTPSGSWTHTANVFYIAGLVVVAPASVSVNAVDDTADVNDGGTVSIDALANDTGSALSIVSLDGAEIHGAASITGGGTGIDYVHTPGSGVGGTDTFSYTAEDDQSNQDTGTVTVTIWGAPVANPDAATAYENQTTTVSPLANDTGAGLTIFNVFDGTYGTATIALNGTDIEYTHVGGGVGASDVISYGCQDQFGSIDSSTITLTIETAPIGGGSQLPVGGWPADGVDTSRAELRGIWDDARKEMNGEIASGRQLTGHIAAPWIATPTSSGEQGKLVEMIEAAGAADSFREVDLKGRCFYCDGPGVVTGPVSRMALVNGSIRAAGSIASNRYLLEFANGPKHLILGELMIQPSTVTGYGSYEDGTNHLCGGILIDGTYDNVIARRCLVNGFRTHGIRFGSSGRLAKIIACYGMEFIGGQEGDNNIPPSFKDQSKRVGTSYMTEAEITHIFDIVGTATYNTIGIGAGAHYVSTGRCHPYQAEQPGIEIAAGTGPKALFFNDFYFDWCNFDMGWSGKEQVFFDNMTYVLGGGSPTHPWFVIRPTTGGMTMDKFHIAGGFMNTDVSGGSPLPFFDIKSPGAVTSGARSWSIDDNVWIEGFQNGIGRYTRYRGTVGGSGTTRNVDLSSVLRPDVQYVTASINDPAVRVKRIQITGARTFTIYLTGTSTANVDYHAHGSALE